MINSFKKMKVDIKKGLNSDMDDAFEILGIPYACVVLGFIGVLILAVALDGLDGGETCGRTPLAPSREEISGN